MLKSIKITVMTGVLGSSVLIGLGAVQAAAVEGPGTCTNNGRGQVRCEDVRKEQISSEEYGTIHLVNDMKQKCSGSGAVSCATRVLVDGEES
ncbi:MULTISPECIES: hypothetical protein [unclassified Streptomyces]|uniref:hypothetical protein n=1 Tax=unclassified Streptomyces TaxID=2593676 RepID=UPI000F6E2867|nr:MULTISPECIES: hypothetical protein [unclassified Streptomyces]AZM62216.1 hypothetical protein DLM49_24200 [Streptomyces sp. WAC 01438]RSN00135.1 hypothetical protein DMA10_05230 [Streptomyces sp. WAC 01420]